MKHLVTSALPYVNNVPHLGNLVCVISADVYSRYLKSKGIKTIYVLGTDEHGTTTETRAIKEGLTPKQVCDKYARIHKEIYDWFECTPDCWGRSSSTQNREIATDIFLKLEKNGFIQKGEVLQAWCADCKRYLSDRYIKGECPYCGYGGARGDQCEKCGKLLEPNHLVNPKCELCGAKPEFKTSEHLFIDLPKIEPELRKWIKANEKKWSTNATTMTYAWLKEGIRPRCITRDLKWGIKVPLKGYEDKVFYSWFDAPIAYIGITAENLKEWKDWWKSPKTTKLIQFMGKDNIPFHTILFPASLIGTKEDYTLVNELSVNEYLNFQGGMFSKSNHVGIFGDDAKATGIPADVWRYYIMVNRPEKQDTEFAWKDFKDKNNRELVANVGNLINRTLTFIDRFANKEIPKANPILYDMKFMDGWQDYIKKITKSLDDIEIKKALREIMELGKLGNKYFQDQKPWVTIKEDRKKAETALNILANFCKDLAILLAPYLPKTAENIFKQLNFKPKDWSDLGKLSLKPGSKIGTPKILFEKIDDPTIKKLEGKFSGKVEEHPFTKLDLRVAEVLEVKNHPDADKLYVMQIGLGKEKRQIVAGLAKYFKADELKGKKLVIVANLEPAKLRGFESNGMLLAAKDGDKVVLVDPGNANPGDEVIIEGIEKNPSKKLPFKQFQKAALKTKEKKVYSKDLGPLRSKVGPVTIVVSDGCNVF